MEGIKKHLDNSSVTIFAVTAIAYVAAFIYEIVYLSVFGVNWRFAQVQIPALITSLASVGFALFMVDYFFTTLKAAFAEVITTKKNPYLHRLLLAQFRGLKIFVFPLIVSLFVFGADSSDVNYVFKFVFLGFLIMFISQVLVTWVPILFNTVRGKSFNLAIKKFYVETDKRHAKEKAMSLGTWVDQLGIYLYPALIVWVVALMGGRAIATGTHKFATFEGAGMSTNVIIKVYSDEVIVKELDEKSSQLKEGYKIMDIKSLNATIKEREIKTQ